jgi:hypothetical protein
LVKEGGAGKQETPSPPPSLVKEGGARGLSFEISFVPKK